MTPGWFRPLGPVFRTAKDRWRRVGLAVRALPRPRTRSLLLLALASLPVAWSCADRLSTDRDGGDANSFGHLVFTLTCKRLAWMADMSDGGATDDVSGTAYAGFCRDGGSPPPGAYPEVLALDAERGLLVPAVDGAFPSGDLDALNAFFASDGFLAAYDDGVMEKAADRLAAAFGVMADDADFAPAMARLDGRLGYRPPGAQGGLLQAIAASPGWSQLLRQVPEAVGQGGAIQGQFQGLVAAASRKLASAEPLTGAAQTAPDRTLNLAVSLMLGESPLLGTGEPRWLVRRDHRGLPLLATPVAAPFVDLDGDGLADADGGGHFLDAAGRVIAAPPTPFQVTASPDAAARDAAGRPLSSSGDLYYQYVDVDRTVLAALAREVPVLLDPAGGLGTDLVRGLSSILAPRAPATASYPGGGAPLAYSGYDAASATLLDLLHGYLTLLADPHLDDTLSLARQLLVDHEPEASRLVEAILATADLAKGFPDSQLTPGSALHDDLVPVLSQILAQPGLAEDVLRALADPAVRPLAARLRDLMVFGDRLDFDPATQQVTGSLGSPVDRSLPDGGFNRSILQRLLHLLADSAGVEVCNKEGATASFSLLGLIGGPYHRCEMLDIKDVAVFYTQSIAYAKDASGHVIMDGGAPVPKATLPLRLGRLLDGLLIDPLVTDDVLEAQSTIRGFRRHPTPQALARALLLDPPPAFVRSMMDPAVCKDGDRYVDRHAGTLAAVELNGLLDQLRPIVQAFADHDREDLLVKLLVVLHQHWPSTLSPDHQRDDPGGHGYAKESDLRSYEPLLAQVVDSGGLWPALTENAPVVNAILARPSGLAAPAVLANAARYLFTPQPGLADRRGITSTRTADGRPVAALSPWYLLADAHEAHRAGIAAAGSDGERWKSAVSRLSDALGRGEKSGSAWRFKDPRLRGVTVALLDFLQARVRAHRAAGDLAAWLSHDLEQDAADAVSGPLFAGAIDLAAALPSAPEAHEVLEGLGVHLTSDGPGASTTSITVAADLLQLATDDPDMVPLARVVGRLLDPGLGAVDAELDLARRVVRADSADVVARLLGKMAKDYTAGSAPLDEIEQAISEVQRARPFADRGKTKSAADYRSIFRAVRSFLDDEKRGLIRFVRIVQNRNAAP
jgi:hypothetical protein